jgi:structural maintenance of chromosome 4
MKRMADEGGIDMAALAEYAAKDAELGRRQRELEAATAARDAVRGRHDELRVRRLHDFMAGFATISGKLKMIYQMITLGGDAELELVDSLDPFAEVRLESDIVLLDFGFFYVRGMAPRDPSW